MSLKRKRFQFGDFILDTDERILLRDEKPVAITPKAFLLLQTLVENHGHIVERDELMKAVWADSFVEEGNLTFTINLVRKVLGDDKQNPRFIKTVPKRGYRFISDVTEETRDVGSTNGTGPKTTATSREWSKTQRLVTSVLALLLIGSVGAGFWIAQSRAEQPQAAILSTAFSVEKLSTDGMVLNAAISPDGKTVVYTNGIKGKQSVWLRQLEARTNVQIIPPSDHFYYGLAFSHDGNSLYFARRPKLSDVQADIYRVSIFGGVPEKIVSESQGWISISPNTEKIAFVRCYYKADENCSLWIADALDGKNERRLVSRPRPFRIADIDFSPSGESIAFAVGQSENQANEFGIAEVDVASGVETESTDQKFFNIKALAWLPDQSGYFVTASRNPGKTYRIWQVSKTGGDARPLTNDSENYSSLSLESEGRMLLATQVKRDFGLRLNKIDDTANAQPVADAVSVNFAPNGSIVFSSLMTGNEEIWAVDGEGSSQKQLTNNTAEDTQPIVSPDNKTIFFSSNRTGVTHVWRMNWDGSNQTQITKTEGGIPVFVSANGEWVYYKSALAKTLWRISTVSGEEQPVLDRRSSNFAISPDGTRVAIADISGNKQFISILSLPDSRVVKTFEFPDPTANLTNLVWSHDGQYLVYTQADSEFENNRLWLQTIDDKKPRMAAELGDDEMTGHSSFALAPDGKSIAVIQGNWKHDAVLLRGLK